MSLHPNTNLVALPLQLLVVSAGSQRCNRQTDNTPQRQRVPNWTAPGHGPTTTACSTQRQHSSHHNSLSTVPAGACGTVHGTTTSVAHQTVTVTEVEPRITHLPKEDTPPETICLQKATTHMHTTSSSDTTQGCTGLHSQCSDKPSGLCSTAAMLAGMQHASPSLSA